jgi:hypothetical protein
MPCTHHPGRGAAHQVRGMPLCCACYTEAVEHAADLVMDLRLCLAQAPRRGPLKRVHGGFASTEIAQRVRTRAK